MSQKKKTSKSFSPYNIHSLPDGSYQFFTDSNIEYRCILSISSSSYIDFPLESKHLEFSFYRIKKGRAIEDKRIGATVSKLLDDVLISDENYLITFICDNTDQKAHNRLKLFKRWFKSHNNDKVALLVEFEDLFYAGILLCNAHPELPKIRSYLSKEKIDFKKEKDKNLQWEEIK